jgi:hypothetical protein
MTTVQNTSKQDGAAKDAVVGRDTDRVEAPRERTAGFGGPRLKLSVPYQIKGFHLFFENDDDNGAIEQLLYEGFSFVTKQEVGLGRGTAAANAAVVADDDVTDRVTRFVGKKADGTAMRAYLLKCPDAVWAEREKDRNAQADLWEESIRDSQEKPEPGRYLPNGVQPVLNNKFRKEY